MSNRARELLERTLKQLNPWHPGMGEQQFDYTLREEIRAYLAQPEVKRDEEPFAYRDPFAYYDMQEKRWEFARETQFDVPQSVVIPKLPLYLHPEQKVPFVRLTEEELIKLGSEHVGPMSGGEFHLMVITQNALEEKNK